MFLRKRTPIRQPTQREQKPEIVTNQTEFTSER